MAEIEWPSQRGCTPFRMAATHGFRQSCEDLINTKASAGLDITATLDLQDLRKGFTKGINHVILAISQWQPETSFMGTIFCTLGPQRFEVPARSQSAPRIWSFVEVTAVSMLELTDLQGINLIMTENRNGTNTGVFIVRVSAWSVNMLTNTLAYPAYKNRREPSVHTTGSHGTDDSGLSIRQKLHLRLFEKLILETNTMLGPNTMCKQET